MSDPLNTGHIVKVQFYPARRRYLGTKGEFRRRTSDQSRHHGLDALRDSLETGRFRAWRVRLGRSAGQSSGNPPDPPGDYNIYTCMTNIYALRFVVRNPWTNSIKYYFDDVELLFEMGPPEIALSISNTAVGFAPLAPSPGQYRFASSNYASVSYSTEDVTYCNCAYSAWKTGTTRTDRPYLYQRIHAPSRLGRTNDAPDPVSSGNWTGQWSFVNDQSGTIWPIADSMAPLPPTSVSISPRKRSARRYKIIRHPLSWNYPPNERSKDISNHALRKTASKNSDVRTVRAFRGKPAGRHLHRSGASQPRGVGGGSSTISIDATNLVWNGIVIPGEMDFVNSAKMTCSFFPAAGPWTIVAYHTNLTGNALRSATESRQLLVRVWQPNYGPTNYYQLGYLPNPSIRMCGPSARSSGRSLLPARLPPRPKAIKHPSISILSWMPARPLLNLFGTIFFELQFLRLAGARGRQYGTENKVDPMKRQCHPSALTSFAARAGLAPRYSVPFFCRRIRPSRCSSIPFALKSPPCRRDL